jgi:tRNA(fMet)-specific endonuclease VapC
VICLDSSFLIDRFRDREYAEMFLESINADVPVLVPTVVLHELYTGALRSGRGESVAEIRRELAGTQFVDFDDAAAAEAAEIRATLQDRGDLINYLDMLIAGVARNAGAAVVAVDRDYGRVPDLDVRDPKAEVGKDVDVDEGGEGDQ